MKEIAVGVAAAARTASSRPWSSSSRASARRSKDAVPRSSIAAARPGTAKRPSAASAGPARRVPAMVRVGACGFSTTARRAPPASPRTETRSAKGRSRKQGRGAGAAGARPLPPSGMNQPTVRLPSCRWAAATRCRSAAVTASTSSSSRVKRRQSPIATASVRPPTIWPGDSWRKAMSVRVCTRARATSAAVGGAARRAATSARIASSTADRSVPGATVAKTWKTPGSCSSMA